MMEFIFLHVVCKYYLMNVFCFVLFWVLLLNVFVIVIANDCCSVYVNGLNQDKN